METDSIVVDDNVNYPYQSLTQALPNTTPTNTTTSISMSTDGVFRTTYSWTTGDVTVTNNSTSVDANWLLNFAYHSNSAYSAYDAVPGWQVTNTVGDFVFDRNVTAEWIDEYGGIPTQSTQSTTYSYIDV